MTLRELWQDLPGVRAVAPLSYTDNDSFAIPRPEESQPEDAEVIEGKDFEGKSVKATETGFTHFLDGAQKALRCGYVGMDPVILAHTSAAIVARCEREIETPSNDNYSGQLELFATSEIPHPPEVALRIVRTDPGATGIANEDLIKRDISERREDRETKLAQNFQDGVLLIDGGIGKAVSGQGTSPFLVGMVKSHQRQYFQSAKRIETILALRAGDRTSVFKRTGTYDREADVASFYLRLREDEQQGPLFGLVRIEIPNEDTYIKRADEIAGWILHERAPLSLPDARFDRMLYPIRLVEKHLKARQPSDAAMRGIVGI